MLWEGKYIVDNYMNTLFMEIEKLLTTKNFTL